MRLPHKPSLRHAKPLKNAETFEQKRKKKTIVCALKLLHKVRFVNTWHCTGLFYIPMIWVNLYYYQTRLSHSIRIIVVLQSFMSFQQTLSLCLELWNVTSTLQHYHRPVSILKLR